jgi:hypothetical protein
MYYICLKEWNALIFNDKLNVYVKRSSDIEHFITFVCIKKKFVGL